MGKLAVVLDFVRRVQGSMSVGDTTADTGGGFNVTAENVAPAGDDAQPLPGDYVGLMPGSGSGREIAVGYMDPVNAPVAGPGGKRIYARDPDTGAAVSQVWLKSDGTVLISNTGGTITMLPDGIVVINGVAIDTSGNISTGGAVSAPSVIAGGKELAEHIHYVASTPGNSGPNL